MGVGFAPQASRLFFLGFGVTFISISSSHPPTKAPASDAAVSSWTKRSHVSFGLVPAKTANAEFALAFGAGPLKVMAMPVAFVGKKPPPSSLVESGRGNPTAPSKRKYVSSSTSMLPPTLAMITAVCPRGPTSSTSTSSGLVCVKPYRFTSTLRILARFGASITISDG